MKLDKDGLMYDFQTRLEVDTMGSRHLVGLMCILPLVGAALTAVAVAAVLHVLGTRLVAALTK